ncbi:asparagine synthetase B family protein [Spirulina major]|uniref:asparagine synthetase B family protein n=1 Tax=Spirulina major TaxID=270636 RepID=UPI000933926C|nr:asparagine synthase-related protein [Spirulina major]
MSGLFALWQRDGQPCDPAVLHAIQTALISSGPDAQTLWQEQPPIALGHTLLTVQTDTDPDRQPLTLDGQVWITASARLDGRAQLRDRLYQAGYPVAVTAPDGLLVLMAYLAWVEDCVDYLQGDFAFAVWDQRRDCLFCGRDQFGIKPLYYAEVGPVVVVSTTIAAIQAHPQVSTALNEEAIADLMLFDVHQNLHITTFQAIQAIPGGHCLSVRRDRLQVRRYWTLPVPEPIRYRDPHSYILHFQDHLEMAVRDRTRSDRIGLLLSGGLDSGLLAATLHDQTPHPEIQAFTFSYQSLFADPEPAAAAHTAAAFHLPHQILAAGEAHPFEGWQPTPEPTLSFFPQLQQWHYPTLARHSRILLYGQGGDEGMRPSTVAELWRGMPTGLLLRDLWRCLVTDQKRPQWGTGIQARWRSRTNHDDLWQTYPTWLNPDFAARVQCQERWQQYHQAPPTMHPRRDRAYHHLLHPRWRLNFETSDPGFHGFPLEFPVPFLDLRLLNYLLAVPPLPWFVDKTLLRATLRDRPRQRRTPFPPAVLERPKTALAGQPLLIHLQRGVTPWHGIRDCDAIAAYVDAIALLKTIPAHPTHINQVWPALRIVNLARWLDHHAAH